MINIIKKDLKLIIHPKRIILSFAFFILVYVLFSSLFSNFMVEKRLLDQVNIGIVDEEESFLSGMLIQNFEKNDQFSSLFSFIRGSEDELLTLYNNNEMSAIVYIPKSFTDSLLYYENTPLRMTLNPNFPLKNTVLESIMSSYSTYIKAVDVATYSLYNTLKTEGLGEVELDEVNDKFSLNMVMTALNRNTLFEYKTIDTFPSSTSKDYFLYSIIILIILFTATSGSSLLSKELSDSCISRYKVSGHNMFQFVSSKVLVMTINIFLSLLPFIAILKFLNKSLDVASFSFMVAFIITVIMFFTSISLLLGIIFNKHEMNMLFSTLVTLLLGIIGGNFIPIQLMPKFIQDLSSFTPNYWVLKNFLYINADTNFNTSILIVSIFISLTIVFSIIQATLINAGVLWKK